MGSPKVCPGILVEILDHLDECIVLIGMHK